MLPPHKYTYQCPNSKELIDRYYSPMGAIPRYTKCLCGNHHAELVFSNELQRVSHQKKNLRRAGDSLMTASKLMALGDLKDPMIAREIENAGKYLKELP